MRSTPSSRHRASEYVYPLVMAFANRDMSSAHHRGFMNGAVTASVRDLYRLDQLFPMAPSAPPALARRLRAWDNPDLHIGLLQALAGENWCAYLHQEHTVTSRIEFAGAVLSIPKDGVWSKLTTDRASLFLVAGPAPSDRGSRSDLEAQGFVPAPLHPTGRTMFDRSAKALTWSRIPFQGISTEG
jgi:hypothetical protein